MLPTPDGPNQSTYSEVDMAVKECTADLRARVFSKIAKSAETSCWLWVASRNSKGYGQIRANGKTLAAHRLVFELEHGPIPDGLCVRHECDNPSCCNPSHLLLGTHQENMNDMAVRGRSAAAMLSSEDVLEIRRLYLECGVLQKDLAARYGVSKSAISSVITSRNYARLGVPSIEELKAARSASRKGVQGDKASQSKMTEEIVRQLRHEYAAGGVSYRQLADKYGMSVMPICNAIRGKSWACVA